MNLLCKRIKKLTTKTTLKAEYLTARLQKNQSNLSYKYTSYTAFPIRPPIYML